MKKIVYLLLALMMVSSVLAIAKLPLKPELSPPYEKAVPKTPGGGNPDPPTPPSPTQSSGGGGGCRLCADDLVEYLEPYALLDYVYELEARIKMLEKRLNLIPTQKSIMYGTAMVKAQRTGEVQYVGDAFCDPKYASCIILKSID